MENKAAASIWDMNPVDIREKINQKIMNIEAPSPKVWSIKDQYDSFGTPIRIYTPKNGNNHPIILLIHGGAWIAGNLDTHDNMARYLCSETSAIVISIDYTNAPEGKFPLQLEQCYNVLLWVSENASTFSGDATQLAVVGDSAGGNMAAVLCLMARDRDGPKITSQILINPAPDLTCNDTLERKDDNLDFLRWQVLQYLSNPSEVNHPYASPLFAKDLGNLPNALIILSEKDDLSDAGQKYADRLICADVPTQIYCQNGVDHLAGDAARASYLARESLDVAVKTIRNTFFDK